MTGTRMSSLLEDKEAMETIYVYPHHLKTDPYFNVRPFSSVFTAEEDRKIERLAESLEKLGQRHNITITPDNKIIDGHRRRRAGLIINERRHARGESLFKMRCVVDHTGKDYRCKAIACNQHHQSNSPMDLCYLISQVREEFNWERPGHLRELAEYFSLDPQNIKLHESLHGACRELQHKVHSGILRMQSALDIIRRVPTKEQPAVMAKAASIESEDQLDKLLVEMELGKSSLETTARKIQELPSTIEHIKHPSVVKAIRERDAALKNPKSLSRKRHEIITDLIKLSQEPVPEEMRGFLNYLALEYARGTGEYADLKLKLLDCFRVLQSKAS